MIRCREGDAVIGIKELFGACNELIRDGLQGRLL